MTVSDARGAEDRGLAHAVAQALADAGIAARPSTDCALCRTGCLEVTVRQKSEELFMVEIRGRDQRAEVPLRLDPLASPFDRASFILAGHEVVDKFPLEIAVANY